MSALRPIHLLHWSVLLTLVGLLAACGSTAPAAPTPPPAPLTGSCSLPNVTDDAGAIRALLTAEGEFVVQQNLAPLIALWVDEGRVVDAKNTPDVADDDQIWDGIDAIRHRYVRTVFPGAPAAVDHSDEEVTLDGARAVVQTTTTIGAEISKAGDRWEMVKRDGCWYLASLTYNLEAAP